MFRFLGFAASAVACSALQIPAAPTPAQVQIVSSSRAFTAPAHEPSSIFPSTLIAEEEEKVSPAKAKILAAKQAAAAKAAAGGYSAPLVDKATAVGFAVPESKSANPFAEADELKEKLMALKEKKEETGKLSKSQSAQLAQLKIMESQARAKAQAEVQAKVVKEAKREAERQAPGAATGGGYGDALAKVTGIKL